MKRKVYLLLNLIVVMLLLVGLSLPVNAVSGSLKIGDTVLINGELEATIIDFQNGQPVYQAVIYSPIYTSSSDGDIYKTSTVYNTARTSATGSVSDLGIIIDIFNSYRYSYLYYVGRGYLYFDTSILSGFTPTAGSINVYAESVGSVNAESIQVQSGMATYPHDPLASGDFDLTNYAGDGGSKAISTFSSSAYNTITLNATGYGWINTTGWTKYCLRTTGDINGVAPTGENILSFRSSEHGSQEPYLSVTFTALTPAIISVAASNVATTTARLNSLITEDGGDTTCQIEFGYGLVSQTAVNYGLYTNHTSVTIPKSDYAEGEAPYLDISGLAAGTPYFYRVQITSEWGSVVSTDEQTFTTTAAVADMTNFIGNPNSTSIDLNWVRASGATGTLVRYRTDTYPTSETGADGSIEVYDGTGVNYTHTGLSEGTTYYYSAWGYSGATYSTNEINLAMTTTGSIEFEELPSGSMPSGFFQEPDESFLVNLEPVYSVINGLADSFQMPRGNMWLALVLLFIAVIGGGLYIAFRAPALSLLVICLLMLAFVVLNILPSFMIIFVVFFGFGAWSTRPQGV